MNIISEFWRDGACQARHLVWADGSDMHSGGLLMLKSQAEGLETDQRGDIEM